jgi:hypothetical protein
VTLLHVHVGPMLALYGALPGINLQLEATNRRVDLVGRGLMWRSACVRVRLMTAIWFAGAGRQGHCLVAGPDLIQRLGKPVMPSELSAGRG